MEIALLPKKDLLSADKLQQGILNPKHKKRYRSFSYIKRSYAKNPSLFIASYNKGKLTGVIFGYTKRNTVLLGEFAISEGYRKKELGKKMLSFFEEQAKKIGKIITLGAKPGTEKFYLKQKYKPVLFLQIKHKDIPKNYKHKDYSIEKETNYKDAKRIFITTKRYDQRLKQKAKKDFNAYNAIYLFEKNL